MADILVIKKEEDEEQNGTCYPVYNEELQIFPDHHIVENGKEGDQDDTHPEDGINPLIEQIFCLLLIPLEMLLVDYNHTTFQYRQKPL
jgi:hypothetical protein